MSTLEMNVNSVSEQKEASKERVSYNGSIVITKKEVRTDKITCNTSKETKVALDKFCKKNGISLSDLGHQLFTDFAKNCK